MTMVDERPSTAEETESRGKTCAWDGCDAPTTSRNAKYCQMHVILWKESIKKDKPKASPEPEGDDPPLRLPPGNLKNKGDRELARELAQGFFPLLSVLLLLLGLVYEGVALGDETMAAELSVAAVRLSQQWPPLRQALVFASKLSFGSTSLAPVIHFVTLDMSLRGHNPRQLPLIGQFARQATPELQAQLVATMQARKAAQKMFANMKQKAEAKQAEAKQKAAQKPIETKIVSPPPSAQQHSSVPMEPEGAAAPPVSAKPKVLIPNHLGEMIEVEANPG